MLVLLVVDSSGIYMMTCLFRCQLPGDELCFPYGGCQKPRHLKPSLSHFPSSREIEEGFFATDSCRFISLGLEQHSQEHATKTHAVCRHEHFITEDIE